MLIRTEIDLLTLARPQSPLHPLHKPAALFDIPQLSAAENAAWTQRFEDLRQQCGCRAGIVGLSVFTLSSFAFILVAALQATPGSPPDYQVVLVNGAMFSVGLILSALLGKLTGLTIAAWRFRQTCRALQDRLKADKRDASARAVHPGRRSRMRSLL